MKRTLSLLLALCMLLALCACGTSASQSTAAPAAPADSAAPAEPAAEESAVPETRVVVDVCNREVEIPYEVKSIVCLGSMGPRFAAYLDAVDLMVGAEDIDIDKESVRSDYSPVYHARLAQLPSVGEGGGSGQNNAYPEQIVQLQPDVILAGFSAEASDELQRQTGIPVVSIRYRTQGFLDEGFYRTMRLFAETVGREERCEEVLAFVDACKEDLDARTRDVPEADKQRAYTGAVTFNGRHGFCFTYVNFPPFTAVNALNVADVVLEQQTGEAAAQAAAAGVAYVGNDGFEVDPEVVIEWDPDIIFLDPGNMDLVNEEYAVNPAFIDSLRAVKEGKVYSMPSTNYAGPNMTYLLINAYYAGTVLYPERFADIQLEDKANEIMEMMLGEAFFDRMSEGGLDYGVIQIGG